MLSHILSRYWWATLIRGCVWVLFGVVVFARPGISLVTLTFLFGVFALADGIVKVMSAIAAQEYEHWWLVLLAGVASIVVGALTFFNPGATAMTLLFFIALWAIVTGIVEIVSAVQLRHEIQGEFWYGLGGLISVAFGVFLLARPGAGALAVLWLIASYAMLFGTIQILLAFEARSFAKRVTGA
jgi:uncharacterized membrane protein HdeD (DUF308 family)